MILLNKTEHLMLLNIFHSEKLCFLNLIWLHFVYENSPEALNSDNDEGSKKALIHSSKRRRQTKVLQQKRCKQAEILIELAGKCKSFTPPAN